MCLSHPYQYMYPQKKSIRLRFKDHKVSSFDDKRQCYNPSLGQKQLPPLWGDQVQRPGHPGGGGGGGVGT